MEMYEDITFFRFVLFHDLWTCYIPLDSVINQLYPLLFGLTEFIYLQTTNISV